MIINQYPHIMWPDIYMNLRTMTDRTKKEPNQWMKECMSYWRTLEWICIFHALACSAFQFEYSTYRLLLTLWSHTECTPFKRQRLNIHKKKTLLNHLSVSVAHNNQRTSHKHFISYGFWGRLPTTPTVLSKLVLMRLDPWLDPYTIRPSSQFRTSGYGFITMSTSVEALEAGSNSQSWSCRWAYSLNQEQKLTVQKTSV